MVKQNLIASHPESALLYHLYLASSKEVPFREPSQRLHRNSIDAGKAP